MENEKEQEQNVQSMSNIQIYVVAALIGLSIVIIGFSIYRMSKLLSPGPISPPNNQLSSGGLNNQPSNIGGTNTAPNSNSDVSKVKPGQFTFKQVGLDTDFGKSLNNTLDGFYKALSNQQYSAALNYLDPDFVQKNNITVDKVRDYFQNEYPQNISYQIDSIFQEKPDLFHAKIIINNPDPTTSAYYFVYDAGANYYVRVVNDQLKISIPYMVTK